jgi:hypothetical protein
MLDLDEHNYFNCDHVVGCNVELLSISVRTSELKKSSWTKFFVEYLIISQISFPCQLLAIPEQYCFYLFSFSASI